MYEKISIQDVINGRKDSPFPIEVIPSQMGINLNSVDSIEVFRQADGQLLNMTINFIPAKKAVNPPLVSDWFKKNKIQEEPRE